MGNVTSNPGYNRVYCGIRVKLACLKAADRGYGPVRKALGFFRSRAARSNSNSRSSSYAIRCPARSGIATQACTRFSLWHSYCGAHSFLTNDTLTKFGVLDAAPVSTDLCTDIFRQPGELQTPHPPPEEGQSLVHMLSRDAATHL